MEKKQKIIIVAIAFALVLVFSGVTYAFFTSFTPSENGSTIAAKGGTMNITYASGDENIIVENIYPREAAWVNKTFTVTGNNTTDLTMSYAISLIVDSDDANLRNSLTYTLTGTNTSSNGIIIPNTTKKEPLLDKNNELGVGSFTKANNAKHTYNLQIFFLDDNTNQNSLQETKFAAHLVINSVNPDGTVVYSGPSRNIYMASSNDSYNSTRKDFSVINTENKADTYELYLVIDKNTYDQVYYTLEGTNATNNGKIISDVRGAAINSNEIFVGTGTTANAITKHDYNLRIRTSLIVYYDNNTTSSRLLASNSKELVAKIEVRAPKSYGGKLLYEAMLSHGTADKPGTDLSQPSVSNEGLIKTTDDYGTAYYYRGDVPNNYVSFAGMCWRIVRTTGNNDIKLVLYNYSSSDCTQTGDTLAFARYDGTKYKSKFNEKMDDNAYIGFMYGTPNSSTYALTHANTNKSTILKNLETWYKNKLSNYTSKLADVIWCNDKSTMLGNGYQKDITYYGLMRRIGNESYSLICPNDNDGGKLSKFTVSDTSKGNGKLTYPIGLLTTDELIYAGFPLNDSSELEPETYLKQNSNETYTTLSPYLFVQKEEDTDEDLAGLMGVYDNKSVDGIKASQESAIRPVIALKSSTVVASGNGTATNPYVIN